MAQSQVLPLMPQTTLHVCPLQPSWTISCQWILVPGLALSWCNAFNSDMHNVKTFHREIVFRLLASYHMCGKV